MRICIECGAHFEGYGARCRACQRVATATEELKAAAAVEAERKSKDDERRHIEVLTTMEMADEPDAHCRRCRNGFSTDDEFVQLCSRCFNRLTDAQQDAELAAVEKRREAGEQARLTAEEEWRKHLAARERQDAAKAAARTAELNVEEERQRRKSLEVKARAKAVVRAQLVGGVSGVIALTILLVRFGDGLLWIFAAPAWLTMPAYTVAALVGGGISGALADAAIPNPR